MNSVCNVFRYCLTWLTGGLGNRQDVRCLHTLFCCEVHTITIYIYIYKYYNKMALAVIFLVAVSWTSPVLIKTFKSISVMCREEMLDCNELGCLKTTAHGCSVLASEVWSPGVSMQQRATLQQQQHNPHLQRVATIQQVRGWCCCDSVE